MRDRGTDPLALWDAACMQAEQAGNLRPAWRVFDHLVRGDGRSTGLPPLERKRLGGEAELVQLEAACAVLGRLDRRLPDRLGTPAFQWTDLADSLAKSGILVRDTTATRRGGPWQTVT
jgi:hypothetical protein